VAIVADTGPVNIRHLADIGFPPDQGTRSKCWSRTDIAQVVDVLSGESADSDGMTERTAVEGRISEGNQDIRRWSATGFPLGPLHGLPSSLPDKA
jgi:hypothetical protein